MVGMVCIHCQFPQLSNMFYSVILLLFFALHVSSDNCLDREWHTTIKNEIDRLNSLGLFPHDFQFTKRVAFVESQYGCNVKIPMSGIWQMNQDQLDVVVMIDVALANKIQSYLGINIHQLSYDRGDLTNATLAVLAFRCYMHALLVDIPPDIEGQAKLWANTYRKNPNMENIFSWSVDTMPANCASHAADVIFIIDSSSSIGSDHFDNVKSFFDAFVESLQDKIGPEDYEIAVVDFSDSANILLELQSGCSRICLTDLPIEYYAGWTNTADGLTKAMEVANRSRNSVSSKNAFKQIAVLITDGVPNVGGGVPATRLAATQLKDAGIDLFTVGIGLDLNAPFLKEISSQRGIAHYYALKDYASLAEGFSYELLAHTCYAQAILGFNGGEVICVVEQNATRFFAVGANSTAGLTVKVDVNTGSCEVYISKTEKFPSEYNYDQKITTDNLGQIYLSPEYLQSSTRKSRSIRSTEFANDTGLVTVNLAVVGMEDTNNITMTYDVGDTLVTTTSAPSPSATASKGATNKMFITPIGFLMFLAHIHCN